jgi:CubicO group peptidase (beta-lactamase class C family)
MGESLRKPLARAAVLALSALALGAHPALGRPHPTPPGPEFDGAPPEYASAFAAKELCSRILIAHANPAPIIQDLRAASVLAPGFSIDSARITVDRDAKSVTVDHPGHPAREAVRAKSQGCIIIPAYSGRLHFEPRRIPWRGPAASRPWPLGERVRQGKSEIDRALLDAALEAYIRRPGTRAVVVVHEGELVGERYAPGFGRYTPQRSWSAAKSVTASLAGLAVDRGALELDARPPIPQWADDERRAITLRHLLNMSSGLRQARYEGTARSLETFTPANEHAFIYFDGFDTYADAIEAPLEVPPGSRWQYRNANVLAVAGAVRAAVRREGGDPLAFGQRELLEPLGMRSTTLETDAYGNFIASGQAFTTARDLARLGLLHLERGRFAGRRLLSRRWVKFVSSPSPKNDGYGGLWWLNTDRGELRSVPQSAYFASGAFGQYSLVIPSHDLVIARMGFSPPTDDDEGLNAFAAAVIEAVERGESG